MAGQSLASLADAINMFGSCSVVKFAPADLGLQPIVRHKLLAAAPPLDHALLEPWLRDVRVISHDDLQTTIQGVGNVLRDQIHLSDSLSVVISDLPWASLNVRILRKVHLRRLVNEEESWDGPLLHDK